MLWKRLIAGSFVSILFLGGLYVDAVVGVDFCFLALMLIAVPVMLREFYALCEMGGLTPFPRFGVAASVGLLLLKWIGCPGVMEWLWRDGAASEVWGMLGPVLWPGGWLAAIFGALWLQATKRDNAATFESISTTLFGLLYTVFLAGFLLDIRHMGEGGEVGGRNWPAIGALLTVTTVGVIKLCDAGAYAFGGLFGRHLMIRRISPKKTYEGAAGGVLFAAATALIFFFWGAFPVGRWWQAAVFAMVAAVFGMYGDLAESLLKRGSGRKDSGVLVPGYGGVLDLTDSLLVGAPAAFLLLMWMVP